MTKIFGDKYLMRFYYLPEFVGDIKTEIILDKKEWFLPFSPGYPTFENCRLKFMNGNIDYRSFQNTINHGFTPNQQFNDSFPKSIQFAEHIRSITGNTGPFGRMTVWNVPPKEEIKPHYDAYEYHKYIVRWIYMISDSDNKVLEVSGKIIEFKPGTMFELYPKKQMHSFINDSNEEWYFLGIDFWLEKYFSKLLKPNGEPVKFITHH